MDNDFQIINPGEDVDPCYGLCTLVLELEHINALIQGKELYTTINVGEYAIIIKRSEKI